MAPAFVHAALAWAAIALVAIPVIIHLWNRRRFRKVDWAAMEFLLQALRKNRRRIRLEGLILLLVRAALMALLAFFLARPLVSEQGLEWLGSAFRGEEKIFVLDDSFSMARRDADRTAFQRATRALAAQVERLADRGGRDRLTVVRSSRPESPLVKGAFLDRERAAALARSLERLSPTDRRLGLSGVVAALAASAGREESAGAARARAVVIVTDLRAADWTDGRGGPDAALAEALHRLAGREERGARIAILDVGTEDESNVAITGAAIEGGEPIAEIPAELRALVKNFGPAAVHGLALRVRYGPAPQPAEEGNAATPGPGIESLAPGAVEEVRIPCTFRKTGHFGLTLEVLGTRDALPGDDSFPLAVEVVPATRVLLVNGEPSSEPFGGETDFLAEALAVPGEVPSGVEPDVVVEENFPSRELDRYAAVFLANWHAVPDAAADALIDYAARGGAVIIFAGDQLDTGLWNRRFAPGPAAPGDPAGAGPTSPFLPARLGALEQADADPWRLAVAFDHPFFRELRAAAALLAGARFEKRFALEVLPEAQVLARFSDAAGSPAITERSFGKGRVVLFASAADLEWSDWPRSPSYLMALHELLRGLLQSRLPRSQALAGSPLEVPCDIATHAPEARLRAPGHPAQPDRTLAAAAPGGPAPGGAPAFRFSITDTDRAGLYALGLKARTGEVEWRQFAVRREALESDLARITPSRLRELYPGLDLEVVSDAAAFAGAGRGQFEAADLLVAVFAALLFVEAYLARRFAHHREPGAGGGRA